MTPSRIVVLVGSLRAGSINRQLAEAAASVAPEGAEPRIYEGLGDVPFYNEDIDVVGAVPRPAQALRRVVAEADGVLIFTPEYNGSIPAVLKNAIDWISRPHGKGVLRDKPVAVVSASPSPNAAVRAHGDMVKVVGIAGGRVVDAAGVNIGAAVDRFGGAHPREHVETLTQLDAAVSRLLDAIWAPATA